jgi:hypothetical protein
MPQDVKREMRTCRVFTQEFKREPVQMHLDDRDNDRHSHTEVDPILRTTGLDRKSSCCLSGKWITGLAQKKWTVNRCYGTGNF